MDFFGLPPWNQYLTNSCYSAISGYENGTPVYELVCEKGINNINDFWLVGASVLEIIIKLTAYLAIGLFIVNGVRMMISQGNPDRVAAARDGMLKTAIGSIIALLSGNLVGFIAGAFSDDGKKGGLLDVPADSSTLQVVLQYVFAIVGALSVLVVIIAGIRYIVSAGNPQKIAQSRSAIIYALVGLVISVSSYIIVKALFNLIDTGEVPNGYLEPMEKIMSAVLLRRG